MGSELQVQNYSGWLQMENSAGLPQKTTVRGLHMENYSNE